MKKILNACLKLFQKLSGIITNLSNSQVTKIEQNNLNCRNSNELNDRDLAVKEALKNENKVIDLKSYLELKRKSNAECNEKQFEWCEILTDEEEEDEVLKALDRYFIYYIEETQKKLKN